MKEAGHQQEQIAMAIGKLASALSCEPRRNCDERNAVYRAGLAPRKSAKRKEEKPKAVRFTATMRLYVEERLSPKHSPEQIVGVFRMEGLDMVSHERIFQQFWQDKKRGGTLHGHLRIRGKRYRKRGAVKDRRGITTGPVDIDRRPAVVEKRKRSGDLETDTFIGRKHKGAIVTMNDRASDMSIMRKAPQKGSALVAEAAIKALLKWKPLLHAVSSDSGKEFADHQVITRSLKLDFLLRQTTPQLGALIKPRSPWSDTTVHPPEANRLRHTGLSRLLCDPPNGGSNTFVCRSFLWAVTPLGSRPRPVNEGVLLTPEGSQNIEVIMPAWISTRRTAGRRAVVVLSAVKRRRDSPASKRSPMSLSSTFNPRSTADRENGSTLTPLTTSLTD